MYLGEIQIPEKRQILAEFASGIESVFEKGVFLSRRNWDIYVKWTSLPVYLPEFGCLISLDTTSPDIAGDFFGTVLRDRKRKVAIVKLHNLSQQYRRAVTWGDYTFVDLGELETLYSTLLLIDIMLSPSACLKRGTIVSPLRYFPLESHKPQSFRCIYSQNCFLVFLDPSKLETARRRTLWLGQKLRIASLRAKFIALETNGWVRPIDIWLSFRQENLEREKGSLEKGYYICVAESFNNYISKSGSSQDINLVRLLYPVVHSPYDIMPFLFPKVIPERLDFVIRFSVPLASIARIIERFEKFEGEKGGWQTESCEELFSGLVRLSTEGDTVTYTSVNPSCVFTIIRRALTGDFEQVARDFLSEPKRILEKVENYRKSWELHVLRAGEFLRQRKNNFSIVREPAG